MSAGASRLVKRFVHNNAVSDPGDGGVIYFPYDFGGIRIRSGATATTRVLKSPTRFAQIAILYNVAVSGGNVTLKDESDQNIVILAPRKVAILISVWKGSGYGWRRVYGGLT